MSDSQQNFRRTYSRIAAVQALYQSFLNEQPVSEVVVDFLNNRIRQNKLITADPETGEDFAWSEIDQQFFAELVKHADQHRVENINVIKSCLDKKWQFERLELIMQCILVLATHEIIQRHDIPDSVTISEYVTIAKLFFVEKEPSLINGILNQVTKC